SGAPHAWSHPPGCSADAPRPASRAVSDCGAAAPLSTHRVRGVDPGRHALRQTQSTTPFSNILATRYSMKSFTGRTVRHGLLYGAISLAVAACATPYDSSQLPEPVQPSFQLPSDQRINAGGEVVSRWWDTLDDGQLSNLVDQALLHNNDISVALANLELARTAVRTDSLQRFPDVSASVSAAEQRLPDSQVAPGGDTRFTSYDAGFDAFWELDLFGRLGDQLDASRAELEATQADLDQVYVTVAAEVARTYIELRGAQHRLDVGQRNVETLEQSHELTRELM